MESLLNHPWVMKGHNKGIDWRSRIEVCMHNYACRGTDITYL